MSRLACSTHTHAPHTRMLHTHACSTHTHAPHTHACSTHACSTHTHAPHTRMLHTHACSTHACSTHTHAPHTHAECINTHVCMHTCMCTHTHAPHTGMHPSHMHAHPTVCTHRCKTDRSATLCPMLIPPYHSTIPPSAIPPSRPDRSMPKQRPGRMPFLALSLRPSRNLSCGTNRERIRVVDAVARNTPHHAASARMGMHARTRDAVPLGCRWMGGEKRGEHGEGVSMAHVA